MEKSKIKIAIRTVFFIGMGVCTGIVSLSLGSVLLSPMEVIRSLCGKTSPSADIVLFVRFPRLILAFSIGASLALSGVIFQAALKNPLADPYLVGVSGGAAFGVAVATLISKGGVSVSFAAFLGSVIAIGIVYYLSKFRNFESTSMLLAGLAMSFILSSCVLLLFSIFRSEEVHRVLMWLAGDLSSTSLHAAVPALIFTLVIFFGLLRYHAHLDIIAVGDAFAHSLGVTRRDLFVLLWCAALLASVSVALAGVIGFVGLMIPHIVRFLFGPKHIIVLPLSALGGAMLLAIADALGRSIVPPYEIPVGVILGFFGGIFFLVLLVKREM
ncbi:MAG: iron ABC transporter permease [Spirochaetes bacterium]|nr:iron ABC transporter permease [Spirochaetota bacterium]